MNQQSKVILYTFLLVFSLALTFAVITGRMNKYVLIDSEKSWT